MVSADPTKPRLSPGFMHGVGYAFLNAKVRGQRSRVYEKERLAELVSRRTVSALARDLYPDQRATDYLAVERRLAADHVSHLAGLAAFVSGAPEKLLRWMLYRYQVENLKVLLRFVATGQRPDDWADYLLPVPAAPPIPAEDLLASESLATFVRRAQLMGFKDLCRELARTPALAERPFTIEAAWDSAFYRELAARADRVGGRDRPYVLELVGHEIDTYAILFALRARLNYAIPADDILRLTPTSGQRVRPAAIARIAASTDLAAALSALPPVSVGGAPGGPHSIEDVETRLWRRTCTLASRVFASSVRGPGIVVAFFYVKRVELMNLIRLVELFRYGTAQEQVRSCLIPPVT